MDLKTSSQPQSRSVIGYDDVRQNAEPSSHYGNNLDDANYYRSDFKHPTESHSHSTYKAQTSPSYRGTCHDYHLCSVCEVVVFLISP